jgi:hypothetical protein
LARYSLADLARRYDFRSGITTHQPVLFAVAEMCDGPIAECGCGTGSTEFLHEVAERRNVKVISFETDANWLQRFSHLASPNHEFRLVDTWRQELERPEWAGHWGLVFVDQEEWPDRVLTVNRVRTTADYIILHDSTAWAVHGLGRTIQPIISPREVGTRDYDGVFNSWREFFPPEPWPNADSGPPTLLASNRFDVNSIPINYEKLLPLWFRIGRHARSFVPQPLKMRIANLIGWRIRPGYTTPPK